MTPDGLDMTFLAAATAPAQVRTHLRFRLAEWELLHLEEDVCLIAAELITNAVKSTPDREIRVRFTRERGSVLFAVWDGSDERPVSRRPSGDASVDVSADALALDPGHDDGTGGWGVPIVEALSAHCGVQVTAPHGKWVWSRVRVAGG